MSDPYECAHPHAVIKHRPTTGGTSMYGRQCSNCGRLVGHWISKWKINDRESLPEWDMDVEKMWRDDQYQKAMHRRESAIAELGVAGYAKKADKLDTDRQRFFSHYDDYLRSDAWRQKRGLVMARARGICEGCGARNATQVHHLDYRRVGREMLFDLVAVCDACHEAVHGHGSREDAA